MTATVAVPIWLFVLIVVFAAVTFASHFLFPSVRWFFRKRAEKIVARLNERLERPIQPFKLARRYDMIQRLIYDPEVSKAIAAYARKEGVPENVAFERARRYAREIVPSFSASAYFGIAIRAAKALSLALYRVRLGRFDEEAMARIDKEATIVFVMNHRSNMDYVLVTWLAAERSALSYAVGEWARVWPLSRLIRAMGAYFIRRKYMDSLYRRVLARYIGLSTDAGVTQAVFPEGGLSLDGGLAPGKLGILKYIVEERTAQGRDVIFIPVALNYDRVFEDRVLIAAHKSGKRRFGAKISVIAGFVLHQLWLWITRRYHRHGYAAASFGAPVSLKTFLADENDTSVEALGARLMDRIAGEIPVLPVPLVAQSFVEADSPLDRKSLAVAVQSVSARLNGAHIHVPRDDMDYAVDVGLRQLLHRGIVQERDGRFQVASDQADILGYYARSLEPLTHGHSSASR
ncbi:MAG: 1-acyl-sn-glycerol-3-phosphate acyltransferase [Pseudomonadota bacterium]